MPDSSLTVVAVAGAAALASVIGGAIALWRKPTTLFMSVALGFAGGVLLATVSFEMVPEALELSSLLTAAVGFALGLAAIYAFDLYVHRGVVAGERSEQRQVVDRLYRRRRPRASEAVVLAGGTSVEEFVEGLSIGVGAAIQPGLALAIAAAVAANNISEGLSIGQLIRTEEPDTRAAEVRRVLGWTGLIGAAVLSSALLGWFFLRGLDESILGFLLAFGAGGLLYLTLTDLVPEAQARQLPTIVRSGRCVWVPGRPGGLHPSVAGLSPGRRSYTFHSRAQC